MVVRSKRYREREKQVDKKRVYSIDEAVEVLKNFPAGKFDETMDLNFQLGVDTKQPDGMIRGSVSLPNGSGKKVKIICFCKGEGAKDASEAGADFVGAEELVQKVQGGWLEFDVVVSHPDMMREVSKLGRILGPKGLMPSPKTGTVATDVGKTVRELKKGKIEIRSDKTGGLHVGCGKLSFTKDALIENAKAVVRAVSDMKPASAKGDYIQGLSISITQGPGMKLQLASLLK
ncbi:MAG TPA: 50S ribosomal protein L1 [Candidatus Omnitrophota bacterium]|nr:50S ribosomal protein L1 [Candidatus Omnitrophota bacterium]